MYIRVRQVFGSLLGAIQMDDAYVFWLGQWHSPPNDLGYRHVPIAQDSLGSNTDASRTANIDKDSPPIVFIIIEKMLMHTHKCM